MISPVCAWINKSFNTKLPDITEGPQPKEHFSNKFSALWSLGAPALGQTQPDLKIIQTTPYLTNQDSDCHSDACKPNTAKNTCPGST